MKVELERQLAEYGRQINSEIIPLDAVGLETEAPPAAPQRPAWAVTLAAVIVVLVLIGGIALLVPGGSPAPLADDPDPAPSTPITEAAPSTVEETPDTMLDSGPIPGVEGSIYLAARWVNRSNGFDRTEAVWYLDADTWRWETLGASGPERGEAELVGGILVRSDDSMFEYLPFPNTYTVFDTTLECESFEDEPEGCVSADQLAFDPTRDGELFYLTEYLCDDNGTCVQATDGSVWNDCTISDGGVIAATPTTRYTCSREVNVNEEVATETLDLWQHESGRTLKLDAVIYQEVGQRDVIEYEVLEIDLNPVFPPDTFAFECPTDDCRNAAEPVGIFDSPLVGEPVPATSGELFGGGTLNIQDLRGERIVLTFWASWCPPCTEDLPDIEALQAENVGLTFITGVVVDQQADAAALISDLAFEIPTLNLTVPDHYLDTVWGAASILGIPAHVFIDEEGMIVAVFHGQADREGLQHVLDQLGW